MNPSPLTEGTDQKKNVHGFYSHFIYSVICVFWYFNSFFLTLSGIAFWGRNAEAFIQPIIVFIIYCVDLEVVKSKFKSSTKT